MTSGAYLGVMLIIYSVILVILDVTKYDFLVILPFFLIGVILQISGIILGTKCYRDKVLEGNITYSNAFITGTFIVLFASIVTAFFSYIFNEFINTSYAERTYVEFTDKMLQFMRQHNYPIDEINQQADIFKNRKILSPIDAAFNSILWNTLLGLMISLITSAFIKKETGTRKQEPGL